MLYRQAVSVLLMSGNTHWERLSRGVKSTDRRAHYQPYLGGIHNEKAGRLKCLVNSVSIALLSL